MKHTYMLFGMTFLFSLFLLTVNAWGAPYISFYSDHTGQTDSYIIDTNGKNLRNLTNHPAGDYCTTWAPDGRSFAFMSERDGNGEIYIKTFNEAQVRRLTNHPELDYGPVWSPDGNWIVFVSERTDGRYIYNIDINGKNLQKLTDRDSVSPAWSPDGQSIAYASIGYGRFGIFVMDADGKHHRQIIKQFHVGGLAYSPTWSPDGKQIACTVSFPVIKDNDDHDGNPNVVIKDNDDHDGSGIYIMDTDGQNPHRVSPLGTLSYNPAWSPDGKWIAYDAYEAGVVHPWRNPDAVRHIFIVSVEGCKPRQITHHPRQNACPAWVPESPFSVSPTVDTQTTLWGWLKQAERMTQ